MNRQKSASASKTLSLVILMCLPLVTSLRSSLAQSTDGWLPAIQLAAATTSDPRTEAVVISPVMVADKQGGAHAFWQSSTSDRNGTVDSTIVYSRWTPGGWSEPIDIVYASRRLLWLPQAAVDNQGQLHLIWENGAGGEIMYAHAPAAAAGAAPNWSTPEPVTGPRDFLGEMTKSIAVSPDGQIHVVHCTGLEGAAIEHTYLTTQWSAPVTVQSSNSDFCRVNLTIDERGRLHLVYVFLKGDGTVIYYTQSDDQGVTWSKPREVADWQPDYQPGYGPNFPSIISQGDEIHIVWLGYPRTKRWHQWSTSRGATWTEPVEILPNLLLSTDAPGLVVDRTGTLHLVTIGDAIGDGTERVYYSTWKAGAWSSLTEIFPEADERAALALTTDGTLNLIWDNDEGPARSIMVSSRELGLAAAPQSYTITPEPLATPIAAAPVISNTSTPASTPTVPSVVQDVSSSGNDALPVAALSSLAVIGLSVLAAALVVAVVFVFTRHRAR